VPLASDTGGAFWQSKTFSNAHKVGCMIFPSCALETMYIFNCHDEDLNHSMTHISLDQTPFCSCLVSGQLLKLKTWDKPLELEDYTRTNRENGYEQRN
jgi:hypothetical protein